MHPQSIIRSYREAGRLAGQHVQEQALDIGGKSEADMRDLLIKCAATSLSSKLVSGAQAFEFAILS